jgi:hypothetical protein
MARRKVHLRDPSIIVPGHTKTRCGKPLWPRWNPAERAYDTSGVVVIFGTGNTQEAVVTVHGTLVTCENCLNRMKGILTCSA